jgi:hypothetical protein
LALSEFLLQQQILDNRGLKWGLIFEAVRIRHCPTSKPSIACVDAANQGRLFFACAFQAEIREQFHVPVGDVSKRLRGGARVRGGHVRHAVVRNTFLNINRIEMRRWSRRFSTTALINRDVHKHAPGFHFSQHRARN